MTKTVKWQCNGCDHLCALLLDDVIEPEEIMKCPAMEWQEVRE